MSRIIIPLVLAAFALQAPPPAMTIVLLVDAERIAAPASTGAFVTSMRAPDNPIDPFIDGLKDGDRATIGGVADRLLLASAPTADRDELRAIAKHARAAATNSNRLGAKPIWDAVDHVVALLAAEPGRRVIMLVTDGKTTGNTVGTDDVARHAIASGVSINIILGFDDENNPAISPATPARALATASGGTFTSYKTVRTVGSRQVEGPIALMKQLMANLHSSSQ